MPLPLPVMVLAALLLACGPPSGAAEPGAAEPAPYRVTLRSPATPQAVDRLTRLATDAEPLPLADDRTLVVRLTEPQRRDVAKLSFVAEITPLQPADRLSPQLDTAGAGAVDITIDLFPGPATRDQAVADRLRSWGADIRDHQPGTIHVRLPRARLLEAAGLPEVRWIEPAGPPPVSPSAP